MSFSKHGFEFKEVTWSHIHVVTHFQDGYDKTTTVSDYFQDYDLNDETVQALLKWILTYGEDEDYPYNESFDYIYFIPKHPDGRLWEINDFDVKYVSQNGVYTITLED